jgi:hypothetical protein
MKKSPYVLLFMSIVFAFQACGDKTNTPEYVMEAFIKAFSQLQFDESAKFATSETQELINTMKGMAAMIDEKERPKPEPWVPLKEVKCVVAQDTTAKCSCLDPKENKRTEPINLVKRKGKWLVKMTKDDMQSKP